MAAGGYLWWYVDALSDDGSQGLTIILFIGSVFSPYYALARALDRPDPTDHVAINVALYGAGGKRWAMTERTRADLDIASDRLRLGPSLATLAPDGLTIRIEEWCVPWPRRLKGTVKVALDQPAVAPELPLDAAGRHRWRPVAPFTRVDVAFAEPARRWSGNAYVDSNVGDEPLEAAFRRWDWSRAHVQDGSTRILYDVEQRDGARRSLALAIAPSGAVQSFNPPGEVSLPASRWRVERRTRTDAGTPARVVTTLEDTPFYARSLVAASLAGEEVLAMHESLSLDRVANPIVRAMLPFRMPRRRWNP